jgi:3-isopropylmalate/(R)-2-methylmalate dehydratase large subunit
MAPQTLYDKLWSGHVVRELPDGDCLIYIDRQLVHEVSSPQAFAALRAKRIGLRRPETHFAVADHAIPTHGVAGQIDDPQARAQVDELERNTRAFGVAYAAPGTLAQGIVHVIGPESGFTLPGTTMVCGDSHTTTHGAFGALAFGIGASECGTVMATQCLRQTRVQNMRVTFRGELSAHVTAKDMALALIGRIGTTGASGHAIEFAGETVRRLDMAGRMTLCNMAIEAGSRIALVAPDDTTFAFLRDRPRAPKGDAWDRAVAYWRTLASDDDAPFQRDIAIDVAPLGPQATWGTAPDQVIAIDDPLPSPCAIPDPEERSRMERALHYMGLEPGQRLTGVSISHVFIGSCTNSRIEDLRAAAAVVRGKRVPSGVKAIVVPGSGRTRQQAEHEGLDRIFIAAGMEWRAPGCSMCVAMNSDRLGPGDRCASTSNRNFEGRQGRGGRTHLMSPAMAAAAAITGTIADVRTLG